MHALLLITLSVLHKMNIPLAYKPRMQPCMHSLAPLIHVLIRVLRVVVAVLHTWAPGFVGNFDLRQSTTSEVRAIFAMEEAELKP